jgi:hypothetical protein
VSGVGVWEQLQRLLPYKADCVNKVVGGATDCDGQENKGGLGADQRWQVHVVGKVGGVEPGQFTKK